MTDRPRSDQVKERQDRNRYAREVIAGSDVQLMHRPSNAILVNDARGTSLRRSLPDAGTPAKAGYLLAIAAILLIALAIYLILDFESATVALFVLSLVLMAGWFVFAESPGK